MKKKLYFKLSVVLGLILLIFISCISDVDLSNISNKVKIDQSIGIPVGEATLSIKDLLTKFGLPSNIDTLSNEIFYQASTTGEYLYKPFNLVDSLKPYTKAITFSPGFIPANIPIDIPPTTDNLNLGINSNLSDQRLDSIKIKSTALYVKINLSSDLAAYNIQPKDITVKFIFQNNKLIFDNGGVTQTFSPTAYGTDEQVNVGGYSVYAANALNIPFQIKVDIKPHSFPIILSASSQITINVKIMNIELDRAYGLFKMKTTGNKIVTVPFDLEKYLPNVFLRFDNPTVDINVSTNIGVNLAFTLDNLNLYNNSNPTKLYTAWFDNHTSNTKTEFLNGPTVFGEWKSKNFAQLNNTNGETNQLFDSKPYPNTLDLKYTVQNSDLTARTQNFISSDSKINFSVNMRMKMGFKGGSYYSGVDTIKNVGQSLGAILDGVDSAVLVLRFANEIPVKAFYRMTFWKSNALNDTIASNITQIKNDSLVGNIFSQYIINAPEVNLDGSVKAGVVNSQTIMIGLNKQAIEDLKKTSFIIFKLQLASEIVNGVANPIHFTTKNSFSVKLGVLLKPNTTLNVKKTN